MWGGALRSLTVVARLGGGLEFGVITTTRRSFLLGTALGAAAAGGQSRRKPPNILYILADDLGFGDVRFLNPVRGKIASPNIDRLATQGMTFTDAHSGSAVCTPTRYGILTGRYAWRSKLQRGVLLPYDPPLIPTQRLTVPAMLKQRGYATACIGKWHLGWNWPRENSVIRFDRPVTGGPTELGFDSYFGTDVPNYPPYCFIRNDRTVGIPSVPKPKTMYGSDGIMLPGWKLEEILPEMTRQSVDFVARSSRGGSPYFLYLALISPHTPLAVADAWRGKSKLGLYGDWVMQTDAVVGEVLRAVDASGQADNTLVVFTSDNGCAPYIGVDHEAERPKQGRIRELEAEGHFASGPYRGYKSDIWEGGHRVPLIARWPGVVQGGSRSAEVVCLTDLMATCADLTGFALPGNAGEDSVSMLPALQGRGTGRLREATVHHSIDGKFAVRQGRWKLALCPGSGGWTEPTDKTAIAQGLPPVQLYDLEKDPGERVNLAPANAAEAERLKGLLGTYVARGRSTPGPEQSNDVNVDFEKRVR